MDRSYPQPQSPRRISERRGKPELQPLVPILPSTMAVAQAILNDTEADIEPSDWSIPSGVYSPENYATPAMSAPATPTDNSPPRLPFGTVSSILGSSIQEEEEISNCGCQDCEARCEEYGLGLAVGAVGTMGTKDVAFPRLDNVRTVREGFEQPCYGTHYHFNEKLAPVAMPLTPPPNSGEPPYLFSGPPSPAIDAEAFSSGPPSLPQSPKTEPSPAPRSRAAIILNKVVPAKLRASFKRRMSGANESASQPSPLPSVNTMPTYYSAWPGTPPEDSAFGRCFVKPLQQNSSPQEADEDAEAILPPSMLSPSAETESYLNSPLQSPRTAGVPYFSRMGSFSETSSYFTAGELVSSPLHPPTISPLMSPTLSSTSQTSLNGVHSHKKVPSIDPATPLAPRKPSTPLTLVTADGLADMIEEMQTELAAYDATLARMVSSGWSSPQEIRNVELQREEHARTWQQRVAESKKILEGTRRIEVKHEATSSVSSLNSAST